MSSNKIFCDNDYTIEHRESIHTTNDTRPVYKTVVDKEKRIKEYWESQEPTVNIGGIEINAEKHIMDETEKNIRAIEKKFSINSVNSNTKKSFNTSFCLFVVIYLFLFGIGTYMNYETIGVNHITKAYYFVIESNDMYSDNVRKRASFFARNLAKKTNETVPSAIYTHELINSKTEYVDGVFKTTLELRTRITINNDESIVNTSYVVTNELKSNRSLGLVKYYWDTKIVERVQK